MVFMSVGVGGNTNLAFYFMKSFLKFTLQCTEVGEATHKLYITFTSMEAAISGTDYFKKQVHAGIAEHQQNRKDGNCFPQPM